MDSLGLWVQPALMLPGVALLLMTTVTRFGQLETQMCYAMDGEDRPHLPVGRLRRCETLLRWATISLYGSVCALALGSLFGGLTVGTPATSRMIVIGAVCVGVALVVIASFMLIMESGRAIGTKAQPANPAMTEKR